MLLVLSSLLTATAESEPLNARRPKTEADLRFWLENMVWYHRFRLPEIRAATGLSDDDITAALARFEIGTNNKPKRPADAPLLVLPYPGGRHPRIGFLDGAVNPQRETKISVFTPWDERSYVVVDVPEAIWSNLGITYLAHTHVPTVWTGQKIELERLEWHRRPDGSLDIERKLPNGIVFGAKVVPAAHAVLMELWLTNGTRETLRDLRASDVDIVTMGQYLSPSRRHLGVEKYYTPAEFDSLGSDAKAMGFRFVESGPLVRSSYHARRHTEGASSASPVKS